MAKVANKKTTSAVKKKTVTSAARRTPKVRTQRATVISGDVSRRAYALFLARGRTHGHDVADWLQAERDLRDAESSTKG